MADKYRPNRAFINNRDDDLLNCRHRRLCLVFTERCHYFRGLTRPTLNKINIAQILALFIKTSSLFLFNKKVYLHLQYKHMTITTRWPSMKRFYCAVLRDLLKNVDLKEDSLCIYTYSNQFFFSKGGGLLRNIHVYIYTFWNWRIHLQHTERAKFVKKTKFRWSRSKRREDMEDICSKRFYRIYLGLT